MSKSTLTFEVEISFSGTVIPGAPPTGPSYASGGEPGYGPEVDDLDIADVGLIELDRSQRNPSHPNGVWKTTSLLEGIDPSDPAIQRLFANILALKQVEAEQLLIDAAEDQWADDLDYRDEQRAEHLREGF